ncbi:hypothetical protein [Fodinibius salsisoli]|uniref:DUF4249 family protein n=1 Tax=Fodinibius salsisoli TaxID=2820877 RepID=A0ABT3PNM9_9BACT|nr:hypothetical protein [Fodinibius salsisoli]MCW9707448.1 DUF4249 family protein [Fodinibius salsisoli]
MNSKEGFLAILMIGFLIPIAGCESNFEPLQENDQYAYSVYGTLDVYADTQWVRVTPIHDTFISSKVDSNNTKVTLTQTSTGKTVQLNDSLFVFGGDAYVWNYWTTEEIHPKEEYVIEAEGANGLYSSAQLTVPDSLSLPLVKYSVEENRGEIKGSSGSPLVRMDIKYSIQIITEVGTLTEELEVVSSLLEEINRTSDGVYLAEFDGEELILDEIGHNKRYQINKRELYVATGSESWLSLTDLSEEEIMSPGVGSNIEMGVGHVAGMAQRKGFLRSCYDDRGDLIFCEVLTKE